MQSTLTNFDDGHTSYTPVCLVYLNGIILSWRLNFVTGKNKPSPELFLLDLKSWSSVQYKLKQLTILRL